MTPTINLVIDFRGVYKGPTSNTFLKVQVTRVLADLLREQSVLQVQTSHFMLWEHAIRQNLVLEELQVPFILRSFVA